MDLTNNLKKLVILILMSAFTSVQASHSCLDVHPQSQRELSQEIIRAKIEFETSQDELALFEELATDARNTKDISTATVTVGVGVIIGTKALVYSLISFIAAGHVPGAEYVHAASLATLIASGKMVSSSLYNIVQNAMGKELEVQAQMPNMDQNCSYEDMLRSLEEQRKSVMQKYFNGSTYNHIKDVLTLGRVSSQGTLRLLEFATVKSIVLETKLQELENYKY